MEYTVIMAGGRGERFWPLSRKDRPKQLLRLTSDKTMLEETIQRALPLIPVERTFIVTGENLREPILDEIEILSEKNLLTEPFGRNTLFAIGLAAAHIQKQDPDGIMVVLSADHLINPPERLRHIISVGMKIAAREDKLITIGIVPTRAETGYGYIKVGQLHTTDAGISVFNVAEFTEKPKLLVAQKYYYGREHLWNSGMFIWSARTIMSAIERHAPEAFALLQQYSAAIGTDREAAARQELYDNAQPNSIDFAVLEKADNTLTIRGDMIWDDVGSWNAIERFKEPDSDHNVVIGAAALEDSFELTVYNEGQGIIAALGVSDLVIVKSGDLVL
ncbi:MAG TPA: mannose-1-phosphate guanylyltransferase, partial [candidate division Zixibacteria bacterium]|nr:mannose-1-phosphate guanylyltransferase [candidate division Zixibacteria bacterium]